VLNDADIYKPITRARYVKHWKAQKDELNSEMEGTDKTHFPELFAELQRYDEITRAFDQLGKMLSKMNALTPEQHQDSDFEQLATLLTQRLKQVNGRSPTIEL